MQERFSDRARHAMALANLEAGKLNDTDLRPAHLMLGLIAEGECVATETLRVLDVDLERVRADVVAQLETSDAKGSVGRRAHTAELRAVIGLAIDEARKLKHRYVGTEHLILGLLAHGDSIPARVFRNQGLDLETLREKILQILRSNVDDAHDVSHLKHGQYEWVHQQELAKAFRSQTFWHTMILAVDAANRMGAGEMEPVHLLMGLLRDPSNGIEAMLAEKDVTVDWVRDRLGAKAEA